MFKTKTQRNQFMQAAGRSYAGHGGGLFSYYTDAKAAFVAACNFNPWKLIGIHLTDADFDWFQKGYDYAHKILTDARQVKVDADAVIKQILVDVEGGERDEEGRRIEPVKSVLDLKSWKADNPNETEEEREAIKRKIFV